MGQGQKILPARFFRTASGEEPVRTWLKKLDQDARVIIGRDICDVEFSRPIGLPLCRSITGRKDLWEVRSSLTQGRIARVLFYVKDREMILLHAFVKKTQKIPDNDLDLAMKRKKEHEKHG